MSKRILTWIRPTATQIHIWNYFAAVKPLIELQKDNSIIAFIANMHALTNLHNAESIRSNTTSIVKTYLALWLEPEKNIIYKQSDIPWNSQLNWVLACITTLGYLKRMHTYKAALDEWRGDEMTLWTFNYPVLMAADILLYEPDFVPVGKDQKQHLEFARDIWERFNNLFGETFKLPEPLIGDSVATVPWIDGRKMSKSYNNYIWIFEDEKILLKKIKNISTDTKAIEEPKDPDNCNVYNILKLFLNEKEDKEIRERYKEWGLSYKEVKDFLYEKFLEFSRPVKEKYQSFSNDSIDKILEKWAEKVQEISEKKIKEIYKKVWF